MYPSNAAPPPTLVVIPTYDERQALPGTLSRLRTAVPHAHALIVDDASPDGTGQWADQAASRDDNVHVLHRAGKEGLGPAYLAGFAWGLTHGYEVLVEMDADASHRPEQLPGLLEALRRGADLAIGSRWVPGGRVHDWPVSRLLLSRGANTYVRAMMGLSVRDATAGGDRLPRLLLPGGQDPPGPAGGRGDRRGPDRFRRARRGREQDELADRAGGAGEGHGLGDRSPYPAAVRAAALRWPPLRKEETL